MLRPLVAAVVAILAGGAALTPSPAVGVDPASGVVVGTVRVNPAIVTLSLSAGTARLGQSIKADVRVTNDGADTLRSVTVELRADRAGLAIRDTLAQVSQIKPGKSVTVSWAVCGRVVGLYVLVARVVVGAASVDSGARLLEITTNARKATCPVSVIAAS
jgi:hypothetical protein